MSLKCLFKPSDYVTVTVTLTGGIFDLFGKIKGTAHQRYGDGDSDEVARCEQTFMLPTFTFTLKVLDSNF